MLRTYHWILFGAVCLGTWDLLFARIYWYSEGVGVVRVLQSVASGICGKASRFGGAKTTIIGAVCHYSLLFASCSPTFWLVAASVFCSAGPSRLGGLWRSSLFIHESCGIPTVRYRPPSVWRSFRDGLERWHARTLWRVLRADSTSRSKMPPHCQYQADRKHPRSRNKPFLMFTVGIAPYPSMMPTGPEGATANVDRF